MPATPATIHVFTYKDGLLARLAHDLRLTLGRFEIQRDGATLSARFWPASLTVDGAIDRKGQVDRHALSDSDRRKIGENIATEVLHLDRSPEASFRGRFVDGEASVEGGVGAHGGSAPLQVAVPVIGSDSSGVNVNPSGRPPVRGGAGGPVRARATRSRTTLRGSYRKRSSATSCL